MKTTTNCPTCGATCTIEGDVTHYYSPNTTGVLSDGQALATAKLLELQQRIAWNRELSDAEMNALSLDPYQFLIPAAELQAENKRLRDIQGLLINWMERHKTDTSYPHKPTQQTYWEQIVSEYPYLAEVDDEMPRS